LIQLAVGDNRAIHSGEEQALSRGVVLVLDKRLSRSLVLRQAASSRILMARFLHKHDYLTVVVVYSPTEDSSASSKDKFYTTIESLITSRPPHDQLVVLGDFNVVTGTNRAGFECVVGNFGSRRPNDNSLRMLTMCSAAKLTIVGSWFQRRDIHRHTWLSNHGYTMKELDHILTNDSSLFKSCRVFRSAESPANSDHHLVISTMRHLYPARTTKVRQRKYLDVETLTQCDELADKYNIAVTNSFQALGSLPEDVEESWQSVRNTILEPARSTLPVVQKAKHPWLTVDSLSILVKKREARYASLLVSGESINAFLRHVLSKTRRTTTAAEPTKRRKALRGTIYAQ